MLMSIIQAYSSAYYTALANHSMYSMLNAQNARMGLLRSAGNVSFGAMDLGTLCAMDTQYETQMISDSVSYQMAKAMLKSLKRLHQEEAKKGLDLFG